VTGINATFNDPDLNAANIGIMLGYPNIAASPAPTVTGPAGSPVYATPGDYLLDSVHGMIYRSSGSTIPVNGTVVISLTYAAKNADVYQFGGLAGVNYAPAQFIHTRQDGFNVYADFYRCSAAGKWMMEFREVEWNLFDAQWELLADLGKTPGNYYFQVRREHALAGFD
jgi:hypothetical protein